MLDTLVSATFSYRGRTVTAQRLDDTLSNKFVCWHGQVLEDFSIVAKTLETFEKIFCSLVDIFEDTSPGDKNKVLNKIRQLQKSISDD